MNQHGYELKVVEYYLVKLDLVRVFQKSAYLGVVTDPITNQSTKLESPVKGSIIGTAINQVVIPGFVAYHIGIESTQENLANTDEKLKPKSMSANDENIDPK